MRLAPYWKHCPNRILLEVEAVSTWENLLLALPMVAAFGTIVIVSGPGW